MNTRNLMSRASVGVLLALLGSTASAQGQTAASRIANDSDLDEVIVTGSRLQTTGFNAPTPVTVVGADIFEQRASATVGETLAEIPAFRQGTGATQGTGNILVTGQALLDLRGLGATRTLVLIDGRRHVPNQVNGTFDTNMIPTALIARTEVVTAGASAAYGSDAVAGVVNFIINDRIEGLKGSVQYGESQRGDNNEVLLGGAYGTKFAGGKGHFVIGGDYSDTKPVGTLYSRGWGRKEAGFLGLTAARPAGVPAFVITDNVHGIVPPGGLISACTQRGVLRSGVACPVGNLTFDAQGQSQPFAFGSLVGTAAMVGGDNEGYAPGVNQYLRFGSERYAVMARATYDINDSVTVFADASAGRFEVHSKTVDIPLVNTVLVNRDNPFIPAALAAQMDANGVTQLQMSKLPFPEDHGVNINNINKFREFVVGARGTVFGDWKWDTSYTTGRGDYRLGVSGLPVIANLYAALYAVAGPTGPVCGPLATNPMYNLRTTPAQRALLDPGCSPINPFGTKNPSQAAYDYTNPPLQQFTAYKRETAQANIAGSPFDSWAGPVSVAAGVEWRDENVAIHLSPQNEARSQANAFLSNNPLPGRGAVEVYEGYLEASLPLAKDMFLAQGLDLNGAIRRTHYSSSGSVTTWKIGATWEPTDYLRFRATRSRDIRAPNLVELYIQGNQTTATLSNPRTGASGFVFSVPLNNPDLKPEKANTWTAGVVFQPQSEGLSGLRASLDWYKIEIKDVIGSVPTPTVVARYFSGQFPEYEQFFTFDSSPVGFSRVISPLLNLQTQRTSGVDIEVAYEAPLERFGVPGRLNLSANGSWLDDLETIDTTGISLGDIAGAIPEWRWTGNINYEINRLNLNLQARYFSQMKYRIDRVGPNDPSYNPASATSINKNLFPSMVYWNLSATYKMIDEENRRLRAFVVVDNLFDKDPPAGTYAAMTVVTVTGSAGYNPYDTVGRSFKVGLRFEY